MGFKFEMEVSVSDGCMVLDNRNNKVTLHGGARGIIGEIIDFSMNFGLKGLDFTKIPWLCRRTPHF